MGIERGAAEAALSASHGDVAAAIARIYDRV
jgi:NACalpha-BTF3-like transcription factor